MKKTALKRSGPPKRRTRIERMAPIKKYRKELRRGEPTSDEKEAARVIAFSRAKGMCQLKRPGCLGYAPLNDIDDMGHQGQLVHRFGKRRFGWRESDTNEHLWGCFSCHEHVHLVGWEEEIYGQ